MLEVTDLWKVYRSKAGDYVALRGRQFYGGGRRLYCSRRPIGLWQDHPPEPVRRPEYPHPWRHRPGRCIIFVGRRIWACGFEEEVGIRLVDGFTYTQGPAPLAIAGYEAVYPPSLGYAQQLYVAQPVLVEQRFQTFSSRIPLVVSEILDRYGASAFISIDNAFFVSLETARTLTNQRYYNLILVRADRIENVQSVVDQLTAIYGERARIIALQTPSSTISGIIGQFSVLLGSVAGISLTVAGLRILNI